MKFVIVCGGVLSGLGKGITTASLALLLKSRGYKVAPVKIDMYLNQDAGTIRPAEHGEVFVTHDGMETDEDLGHYERFMDETLTRVNYITTGQIYAEVLRKERAMEYGGEDVEAIPHVTDEIIRRITLAGETEKADIVIIELGGTVGEYQNGIFFEATRIMKLRTPSDLVHIHVTYLPYLSNVGELKSKPAQTSVHILNGMGIQPEIMVARSQFPIDTWRAERLALFTSIYPQYIFPAHDAKSVYEVPLLLAKHNGGIDKAVLELLHVKAKPHKKLLAWQKFVKKIEKSKKKTVTIAMVGKYSKVGDYKLTDSYVCVNEALKHAAVFNNVDIEFDWISSDEIESGEKDLSTYSGIVVPQGWGSRGTEGKIRAAQFAREHDIPYLGLCFGMQMASIEFGRNVVGLKNANSEEVDSKTKYPVIHVMPHQKEYLEKKQYGGTIRLGAWPCVVKSNTKLYEAYKVYGNDKKAPWWQRNISLSQSLSLRKDNGNNDLDLDLNLDSNGLLIHERHRHRYEFNNEFRKQFEEKGFVFSGTSPDGELVEAIELKDHPFFVGTQFHPEYESRPLRPHPIFVAFVKALL